MMNARTVTASAPAGHRSACGAVRMYWDAELGAPDDVVLVFGRETGGLPREIHEAYGERMVTMPIHSPHVRSLNLSTCVGIALYEVLRQRATPP